MRLNAHVKLARALPPLVLVTDDERLPDPLGTAHALHPGSLVILRARDAANRAALAMSLMKIARLRHLCVLIADDPELAVHAGAAGIHVPEARVEVAAHWRIRRPDWLMTCAAHSLRTCAIASRARFDAALLSPVFPTRSHPGRASLGPMRARFIARMSPLPVYALGGIGGDTAARLAGSAFAGLAAVEALANLR